MIKQATVIEVENVYKSYGKRPMVFDALRGISLSISGGDSLAIVGKSGSGKSTLMHILAGLDRPSRGQISWSGHNLNNMDERQLTALRNRGVGFIFQQFFLQPTMTVLENVVLPLKIAGISKLKRHTAAVQALKAVGLLDKANNRATDLSGGQKQRTAIARALINNPDVIFADEPTGNLDTETGSQIIDLLFDIQRKEHISLVIVTHDDELAKRCARTIHIKDGKIDK
ncbi:MAG TPA: ABC transporter ATP-binding protein [Candidatus Dormibacteraeota bacterium]|nr:ABC transporter ATP-binding protein [Candidatus Dormibacteraeota bacterium]